MILLLNGLLNGLKKSLKMTIYGFFKHISLHNNIVQHILKTKGIFFLQLTNEIFQNKQSPKSLLKVHINSLFCECTRPKCVVHQIQKPNCRFMCLDL